MSDRLRRDVVLREGPMHVWITDPKQHYQPISVYLNMQEYVLSTDLKATRQKVQERYGADCGAGHQAGIRRVTELDRYGNERTWYECLECRVTVHAE